MFPRVLPRMRWPARCGLFVLPAVQVRDGSETAMCRQRDPQRRSSCLTSAGRTLQQEDHKIITLLTEQTALLRNMAVQPSLADLLTTQTQVLNTIMQQNQEILIALRSLTPINILATPSLAPVPSPTTSTPIHPRSNTPSTPDNVERLTVSPLPTGKKRKTVVIKQSKPPDKSKGKN